MVWPTMHDTADIQNLHFWFKKGCRPMTQLIQNSHVIGTYLKPDPRLLTFGIC